MKRALRESGEFRSWHYVDGQKIQGPPPGVSGDLTGVSGDLTGVRGSLSGVCGDLDDCELTPEERIQGVNIKDLIEKGEQQ